MSLLLFLSADAAAQAPTTPPVVVAPTTFVSVFSQLVARVDRTVQAALGGEPIVYQPATGPAVLITGIFDNLFVIAKGDALAGVEALGPSVFVQLADLPADPETDEPILTIRGVNYRVIERRPADFGSMVLVLRSVI